MSREPGDAESRITAAVPVTESEAVVAGQSLRTRPADEGYLELVGQWRGDDGVVGAVRTGDADTALIDEVLEPVRGIASRATRQAVFRVEHELDGPVEQALLERFIEGHPVDLVVAAIGTVER